MRYLSQYSDYRTTNLHTGYILVYVFQIVVLRFDRITIRRRWLEKNNKPNKENGVNEDLTKEEGAASEV